MPGPVGWSPGLVAAATLTPTAVALDGAASDGVCRVSRFGLVPLGTLLSVNGASLNVLLFLPLGVAIGLLPRTRATLLVLLAAIALPFVVEAVQLVLVFLGRQCQVADIFDNLAGLAVGLVLGATAYALLERRLTSSP